MCTKGKMLKAISVFVAALFLFSNIAWSEPISYLRPQSAGERGALGAAGAKASADIGALGIIVEQCSRQLIDLKGKLGQKKTQGNTALFGAWAERRMLALQDMSRLKRWLVANNPQLPAPVVDLSAYGTPVTMPVDPNADEETAYSFFPDENIVKAGEAVSNLGAAHANRTLSVFMAGGKGTRLRELYEMSDERRHEMGITTPREKFEDSSKPTVPLTIITEESPFAYDLRSARRIAQDEGEIFPPVIMDGADTREQILKSLRANRLFGFKRIIVKSQRSVPACNTYDSQGNVLQWGPVEYSPGGPYIESPDGGGGTLMAMGDTDFLVLEMSPDGKIVETRIQDKSPIEWLGENYPQPEAVNYIQTDMAVDVGVLNGLTGTRARDDVDVAAMTLDYPRGISVKVAKDEQGNVTGITVGEMYALGTVFSTGEQDAAIVEYGERGNALQDNVMRTLYGVTNAELNAELKKLIQQGGIDISHINAAPAAEREKMSNEALASLQSGIDGFVRAHENLRPATAPSLQGNVGAYSIRWPAFQDIVRQRSLKPHVQWRKKQKRSDGSEVVCEASELFAPDLKVKRVFGVPNEAAIPAKDPEQFVACRNALAKRHMEKLTHEFGVTQIGEGAVIEFSPLFRGSVDSSLRIGKNAKLYLGGSGIGSGFNVQIGRNVEIADGTTVIIEGNGPVTIEPGVKFGGGVIKIRASEDGQPIVIKKGYVYKEMVLGAQQAEACREEFESVVAAFGKFVAPDGFVITPDNCEVDRNFTGNINRTWVLTTHPAQGLPRRYVVQELGPVFNVDAINNNLQLHQIAQEKARALSGILPGYWEDSLYLDVSEAAGGQFHEYTGLEGTGNKVFKVGDKVVRDGRGKPWRIMRFLEREETLDGQQAMAGVDFIDAYNKISEGYPGVSMADAATNHGAVIATFGGMINCIKADIDTGRLPALQKPLAGFHNTAYHNGYRDAAFAGKAIRLSLKQKIAGGQEEPSLEEVPFDPADPDVVRKDESVIATYGADAHQRIDALQAEYQKRAGLASALNALGTALNHMDTKVDNFPFRVETAPGGQQVLRFVGVTDLDTIQEGKGLSLDDMGDLLRSAANPAGEKPKDINTVSINDEVLINIIRGYVVRMRELGVDLDTRELNRLALTAMKVYFFELGSRFFADSLVGNKYFRLDANDPDFRPDMNLYRGEVQMRALQKLEAVEEDILAALDRIADEDAATNPLGATGQADLNHGQAVVAQIIAAI